MDLSTIDLQQMKKNYGKTTDEEIRELLNKIKLVILSNKGIGTINGYYTFDKKLITDIKKNPREISHNFSEVKPNKLIKNLSIYKELVFYVKSTSRFFLKADIGEVFDQMSKDDKEQTLAIYTTFDHILIECPEYDEFLMTAYLLK